VRRDRVSNLYRVNFEVCESVECRVSKGKMLQRVPVALLVTVLCAWCRAVLGLEPLNILRPRPRAQMRYQFELVPEDGGRALKI
jgi:hypothetical protein